MIRALARRRRRSDDAASARRYGLCPRLGILEGPPTPYRLRHAGTQNDASCDCVGVCVPPAHSVNSVNTRKSLLVDGTVHAPLTESRESSRRRVRSAVGLTVTFGRVLHPKSQEPRTGRVLGVERGCWDESDHVSERALLRGIRTRVGQLNPLTLASHDGVRR